MNSIPVPETRKRSFPLPAVRVSLLFCMLALPLFIGSCRNTDSLYESGVSLPLAQARKQAVSALEYDLFFHIPRKPEQPVQGAIGIRCSLDKNLFPYDLPLDFKENPDNIRSVNINGNPVSCRSGNEHLILPAKELKNGENEIRIEFIAGEQSLNRNPDYLYTLLVPDRARTLFPCFDQPDLKAVYRLTLTLPREWEAVGNSPVSADTLRQNVIPDKKGPASDGSDYKTIAFAPTEPLSTYLFSYVAGRFNRSEHRKGERIIHIFHRETDPQKTGQLDEIAGEVFSSLEWMEEYTGIPYPFAKYDLIILPGFQFGGMEHTGATLYNDGAMFLPEHPTLGQRMGRARLVAHETAHMWFGDLVTMKWFNDVWTKEVFANFFADKIVCPMYPEADHRLGRLGFYTGAYSEDRTDGTTPIQQELPNLKYAGLVYGQIVYQKSPVVMSLLYDLIGEDAFRNGIREYLDTYRYGNADWNDLIEIFCKHTPYDLRSWSDVWIRQKGMPQLELQADTSAMQRSAGTVRTNTGLILRQSDRYGRHLVWQQPLRLTFVPETGDPVERTIFISEEEHRLPADSLPPYRHLLPNLDGQYYGYIRLAPETIRYLAENLYSHPTLFKEPVARKAVWIMLNENYLAGDMPGEELMRYAVRYLPEERHPQLFPSLLGYISSIPARDTALRPQAEQALLDYLKQERDPGRAGQAFSALSGLGLSDTVRNLLYNSWLSEKGPAPVRLTPNDITGLAYRLALLMPLQADSILQKQRERITHPDLLRKFDYIARSLVPDTLRLDSLFNSLLMPENRAIEPWTRSVLSYLNHPLRQKHALKYIRPGLEEIVEIQQTGDIFFPQGWAGSLLGGHRSPEAAAIVERFLQDHPDYLPLLKNKILQNSYTLRKKYGGAR